VSGALPALTSPPLPGGAAWQRLRAEALARVTRLGLPGPRDDAYKYANLRLLERRTLAPPPPGAAPGDALERSFIARAGLGARLVFLDGRFQSALSAHSLPAGLSFEPLTESIAARTPEALGVELPGDGVESRLRLLATAFVADGGRLALAPGARPEQPLALLFLTTGAGSYPRLSLSLGAGSALTLVEEHASVTEAESVALPILALELAEHAELEHYRVQAAAPRAIVLEEMCATLAREARYAQVAFALGGQLDRLSLEVRLAGPAAETRLSGLTMVEAGRQAHVRTRVVHGARETRSTQLYRAMAGGRSRASYDGLVRVDPGATKAQSRQSIRNLLLTPEAEIDTRPQLEIHTDDVACSHGATTGALDENMLFYLLSRGLEPAVARGLLLVAFAADVLRELAHPALRAELAREVRGALTEVAAITELAP
jgi:Fe-S cluster assembly protein SufD